MFLYKITNLVNNKMYIGITIDYQRRWKEHINRNSDSLIHKAIKKYGEENFLFEILQYGLKEEEAEKQEIEAIQNFQTLVPNGYNIAKGGLYGGRGIKISDEIVADIKNHRNIPMCLLYENYFDKMSYGYFKSIYHDQVRKDVSTTVAEYPNNLEFSCQFTRTKLSYSDIVEIRKAFKENRYWKDVYLQYSEKVVESTFWDIWRGRSFKLIMPEVFSLENKWVQSSLAHSGERNSHAKLTVEDVKNIRKLKEQQYQLKEIHEQYPQVSLSTIKDVINYRTWKNVI